MPSCLAPFTLRGAVGELLEVFVKRARFLLDDPVSARFGAAKRAFGFPCCYACLP
ncbi:MAG: hypothetical protein IT381_32625 [Deltaproteobacteria bacterium]|nr:hypothetical protein [Deltaproteobacteria bacterium]